MKIIMKQDRFIFIHENIYDLIYLLSKLIELEKASTKVEKIKYLRK
jgi:hypothetical protein